MLSMADVMNNISFFIGNPKSPSGLCTFQAIAQQVGNPQERGVRSEEAEAADVGELKARKQQAAAAAARARREDPQEQERKRVARQQREAAKTEEAAKQARLALMREKLAPTTAGDTSTGRDGRPVPGFPGWAQHRQGDDPSGYVYYHNASTGETSWTHPESRVSAPGASTIAARGPVVAGAPPAKFVDVPPATAAAPTVRCDNDRA